MYIKRVAIAFDQLLNTIGGGQPDETISAKIYRKSINPGTDGWKFAEKVVNTIFFDKNHCKDSYMSEIHRTQFPRDYRRDK